MAVFASMNTINEKGALLIKKRVTCTGDKYDYGYGTLTVDIGDLIPNGIATKADILISGYAYGGGVGFFNSEGKLENMFSCIKYSDGSTAHNINNEVVCRYGGNVTRYCTITSASYSNGIMTLEIKSFDDDILAPYSKNENISFYIF